MDQNSLKAKEAAEEMAAEEGEVKVLGMWASPFVMRARIALRLKGVAYELLEENLVQKSELLLASNPVYKKVPVLIHGGRPVCESLIIVQYVDDVWPSSGRRPPLLPVDRYERALHRFWAAYFDDKVFPAMGSIVKPGTEVKANSAEEVFAALNHLEAVLAECGGEGDKLGHPFFGGDEIGYLDIAVGSMLGWLRTTGKLAGVEFLDAEKMPLLVAWAQNFCDHEAVKDLMHDEDKLLELAKLMQQATK
ncbi:glutathione S-transferase U17-like [Canna indica]|uniref:Glutathione S-transferase n=1 Tax=Canna indica TaxID=4628 RepID=A0AAQ3K1A5_9LILI|nr:glutathione S-transferase U17-like [Canna indica]